LQALQKQKGEILRKIKEKGLTFGYFYSNMVRINKGVYQLIGHVQLAGQRLFFIL